MTVRIEDGTVFLEGRCLVEDAEPLLLALLREPMPELDLAGASYIHLAVAQVALACRPELGGLLPDLTGPVR